ncbi:MAG: hypothetical protein KJ968_00940 [Nanoarchaeota archaeon]|nr:hypothetical protein [Nanoarchaeota archaeon]
MVKEEKHIIEVCCTGNLGRSPMAEVIGNHTVVDMGLEGKIGFISSGILVDPKYDKNIPYCEVVSILDKASKNDLVEKIDVIEEKYNKDPDYREIIEKRARVALEIMRPIEAALRTAALYNKFNINLSDRKRCQTVVREDVSVILGMEERHVSFVKKMYEGGENTPTITTITRYAGFGGEIPVAFGKTNPKVYVDIGNKLEEIMPKVVLRFKEEKNL